jgi:DNA-binding transcriptional LysR family regulator
VQTGSLDIAVMYTPHQLPGTEISPVLEEELIAVTTSPGRQDLDPDDYVFVDWGPDFSAQHDLTFPGLKDAGLCVGLGPLALRYILLVGGTGYFRTRAVQPYLNAGQLHVVPGTPTFSYTAYVAHSAQGEPALIEWARNALVKAADVIPENWLDVRSL